MIEQPLRNGSEGHEEPALFSPSGPAAVSAYAVHLGWCCLGGLSSEVGSLATGERIKPGETLSASCRSHPAPTLQGKRWCFLWFLYSPGLSDLIPKRTYRARPWQSPIIPARADVEVGVSKVLGNPRLLSKFESP